MTVDPVALANEVKAWIVDVEDIGIQYAEKIQRAHDALDALVSHIERLEQERDEARAQVKTADARHGRTQLAWHAERAGREKAEADVPLTRASEEAADADLEAEIARLNPGLVREAEREIERLRRECVAWEKHGQEETFARETAERDFAIKDRALTDYFADASKRAEEAEAAVCAAQERAEELERRLAQADELLALYQDREGDGKTGFQRRAIRIADEYGPCYVDDDGVTVHRIGASDVGCNCACGGLLASAGVGTRKEDGQ